MTPLQAKLCEAVLDNKRNQMVFFLYTILALSASVGTVVSAGIIKSNTQAFIGAGMVAGCIAWSSIVYVVTQYARRLREMDKGRVAPGKAPMPVEMVMAV